MKRVYLLLVFIAGLAVINGYGFGGKEQITEDDVAEITGLSDRIAELEKEQKSLKDEIEKNKKDMDGLARKLESLSPGSTEEEMQTSENDLAAAVEVEIEAETLEADDEQALASSQGEDSSAEIDSSGGVPTITQNIILAVNQNSYLTPEAVIDYMVKYSRPPSWFGRRDIETLVNTYFREAKQEQVNPAIALAQMWYATQSLTHYALLVNYNYANLEPIKEMQGMKNWDGTFSSSETGVRAHIQHLKGYASIERPADIVDPRYEILVRNNYLGKGDTIDKLCAMWTKDTSGKYKNSLNEILEALYKHQDNFIN